MDLRNKTPYALAGVIMIAAWGCGGGSSSGGSSGGGGALAVVNDEEIGMEEFHNYLERKPTAQVVVQDQGGNARPVEGRVVTPLAFQALRDMVHRRLLLQIAKDEKVFPTDADIDKELQFQTKRNPNFIRSLTNQGLTLESIKNDLRLDLAKDRIITKGITVTPQEVDKFIKDNPRQFTEPARATVVFLQVSSADKKQRVDQELASGSNFREVANRYNEAVNARRVNHQWPTDVVNNMHPKLREMVQKTPELKATEWLQDGGNWLKFYVEKKSAARPVPITDEIKELVRRAIANDRGSKATDLGKRLQQKLREAKIDVRPQSLKQQWDKAFEQLKQEAATQPIPGTTSTPGATTAGTTAGATAGGTTGK